MFKYASKLRKNLFTILSIICIAGIIVSTVISIVVNSFAPICLMTFITFIILSIWTHILAYTESKP